MQKVFCVNQPKKHNASIDPPKIASNDMHKTEMRQKSPPKNASKITTQINASKITPQKSASKFSASKIIKNINASKFCASEITPSVSASYATLRQNSMSQNSRVIVPCVKRSVRHRPFSPLKVLKKLVLIWVVWPWLDALSLRFVLEQALIDSK